MTEADLGGVRFGISPLCELGLSLRAIRDPSQYPLQLPWLRRTEEARSRLDLEGLLALVDDRLWTPDFLNPRPQSPLTRIDDEFATLERISAERFHGDLIRVHGVVPAVFGGSTRSAVRRMVLILREFWDTCFSPHWPRMRTILEADIVYRGRQIAQGGLFTMLNDLSGAVGFDGRVISVRMKNPESRTEKTDGLGLTLVPTMFTRRASAPVNHGDPPMLMYPARGQGAMWEAEHVRNPAAVVAVLGDVRTSLLTALAAPASSTELGVRFGVTASAVNQHLRALRDAGLVTSTRYGHSVLYFRSELGSALLLG
ncbi:DNA-binding transcriptional ArsR family regulator [Paenarthrobacter ilicis]|uniref:DNA-binding transcriptional ArsR family regulator n=1 Tax=Paenarthrobacter ilicis TaxID=43665 RepID=A0ABX0TJS2_9MICC|nr:DNA-binding transcriptional ArsR family regulator [Paenarthrobacter ilicis]